jgi:hypothetical protein
MPLFFKVSFKTARLLFYLALDFEFKSLAIFFLEVWCFLRQYLDSVVFKFIRSFFVYHYYLEV